MRSITIGPLAIHFTNRNRAMNIKAHSHYAEVTITFTTDAAEGFPVFANTVEPIRATLRGLTANVFPDHTNERIAEEVWAAVNDLTIHRPDTWRAYPDSAYRLHAIELAVRGVPDDIGHDDSFTRYRIEAT